MKICKKFEFEASHIVRNCSSERCKYSKHGHSFKVDIFLETDKLDNGQMVYDFGLLKNEFKTIVDSFDHTEIFWSMESDAYKESIKLFSERWVELPVSPSAEMLSLIFLKIFTEIINTTTFSNGEGNIIVSGVRLHETRTGWAESSIEDLQTFGLDIDLQDISFSDAVKIDWNDSNMYNNIIGSNPNPNPHPKLHLKPKLEVKCGSADQTI